MYYSYFISVVFVSLFSFSGASPELNPANEKVPETSISIHAKERGFPRVNFKDGTDLKITSSEDQKGAAARLLTSADFDSDGTADVILADAAGGVKLYRGNAESIFPNYAETQTKQEGLENGEAFYQARNTASLSFAPDFLVAGDFNTDGFSDVLAAARGASSLYLLSGDGSGNFFGPREINIDGGITSLVAGEIGRQDGQADLAVAISNQKGAHLLVFEHPEGAFAHAPESIKLASSATSPTIGHLDADYFGDIAAANGNKLTIVRGRGHAYPWDSIEGYDIERPAPIVETRTLPFQVADLTAGYFTEKRGQSLAILTTAGTIQTLDSPAAKPKASKLDRRFLKADDTSLPVKSEKRLSNIAAFSESAPGVPGKPGERMHPNLFKIENGAPVPVEAASETKTELREEEQAALRSGRTNIDPNARERSVNNFLRAISPKETEPLARWNLRAIASDARLASAAASLSSSKLVKVRVSDSGRDELAFIDTAANQIHLMIRENLKRNRDATANEFISFDVEGSPVAILPMRLNVDALSDLVVLRASSAEPSILMTAPAATFLVTTASDEDNGSCGASCSLREAIDAANNSTGADTINFSIGSGTQTIRPEFEGLPQIEGTVTINATTQPGYTNRPLIEIKGNLADEGANGLRVNAANCVIRGIAANEFQQLRPDPDEPGVGGYGITIYNFEGETFSAFNIVEASYLGTDPMGLLDRGNEAGGLYIFDSDNNRAGSTTASLRNVMSGNGNSELANGDKFASGMEVVAGNGNLIIGNYFGLTASGNSALGNSTGLSVGGANNTISGDAAGSANVASGNRHNRPVIVPTNQGWCGGRGISDDSIVNVTTEEWLSELNIYKGNRVGTNATGTAAVGNCSTGLFTSPRNTALVGSSAASGRNIVSGNSNGGLICSPFEPFEFFPFDRVAVPEFGDEEPTIPEGFCKITGNYVGTDITGNVAIPNNHDTIVLNAGVGGIFALNVFASLGVYNTVTLSDIGGIAGTSASACSGVCNLVSGNRSNNPNAFFQNIPGINRAGRDGEVVIYKNYVGTNVNGTSALGNNDGVRLWNGPGATRIGDVLNPDTNPSSLGNLISGNSGTDFGGFGITGARDTGGVVLYIIRGNLIGTDRTGVTAIPNARHGIELGGEALRLLLEAQIRLGEILSPATAAPELFSIAYFRLRRSTIISA